MRNNKEILSQRIKNGISSPFNEELINLIKPAIRLFPQKNKRIEERISKMGGLPLIGANEEWPRTEKENKPYAFLLQLDLGEISEVSIENELPKNGLLSFFFNLETWDDGKVFYHEKNNQLIQAPLPEEFYVEEKRKQLPFWKRLFTKRNSFHVFEEHFLEFKLEYQMPSWDSLQMELFHLKGNTTYSDLEVEEKFLVEYNRCGKKRPSFIGLLYRFARLGL